LQTFFFDRMSPASRAPVWSEPSGCCSFRFLGVLHLPADLVHVEILHLADQILEYIFRKHARLSRDHDPIPYHHEGGDRLHVKGLRQLLLLLGVHTAEDDVGVPLGGLLQDREEPLARRTPGGPEVDYHGVVVIDYLPQAFSIVQRADAHRIGARPRPRRGLVPFFPTLGPYPPSVI
jgi:hypothetical protein